MSPATILMLIKLLDLVVAGIALIPEIRARYEKNSAKLRAMIEEGREPTAEEFNELLAESDQLTQAMRDAVAAKEAAS